MLWGALECTGVRWSCSGAHLRTKIGGRPVTGPAYAVALTSFGGFFCCVCLECLIRCFDLEARSPNWRRTGNRVLGALSAMSCSTAALSGWLGSRLKCTNFLRQLQSGRRCGSA